LGQQVVIENRPGASGNIGYELAAKAAPDGYTLTMVDTSYMTNPSLFAKLPIDFDKDLIPLSLLASGPVILVVHPSLAASSVKELIALAKAQPGKLNFASGGNGSSTHLGGELFKLVAGVDILHVPYKGTGAAVNDLLAGQVTIMFAGISQARGAVEGGALRGLAVTGATRAPAMPSVPTFDELGIAGVDSSTLWGTMAPAALPRALVERLNAELVKAVRAPDLKDRLVDLGYTPIGSSPDEFGTVLRSETEKWAGVIKRAGITPD
ncbi:MAG: tripartite tricarboxylate transporter substrate binding protein, partial [Alphaproteobacteria bacterium]|nr:tripartite tricarboxylate transporter substrate binding protein [Alphaproteobacteria bacterium]